MSVALLDPVENALLVANKRWEVMLGSPPDSGSPTRILSSLIYLQKEEITHAEVIGRLRLTPDVCDLLGIHPEALPDPTTFYHSLDRYAMYVWRALLRLSARNSANLDTLS